MSKQLCKNIVANEDEFLKIISYFVDQYKSEKDLVKNTEIIQEFFIFLLFNHSFIKSPILQQFLKRKIIELKEESNLLEKSNKKLYDDLQYTFDEMFKILV